MVFAGIAVIGFRFADEYLKIFNFWRRIAEANTIQVCITESVPGENFRSKKMNFD